MYFMIINIKPLWNKPYEIVVDLTRFTMENEWPNDSIETFEKLLSSEALFNLKVVYFYNANSAFKKYAKKLPRNSKHSIRILFINSLDDFSDHLNDLRFPKSTLNLEKGATTITPVTKIATYQTPVVFKISQNTIQIMSTQTSNIFGCPAILNDVFHIDDIDEIFPLSNRTDEHEFILRYSERSPTFNVIGPNNTSAFSTTFSSPKREIIVHTIKAAKSRSLTSRQPNLMNEDQRHLSPSDVPGTLLNMAILNIGSADASLRLYSYNLLVVICEYFKFDIKPLLSCEGN